MTSCAITVLHIKTVKKAVICRTLKKTIKKAVICRTLKKTIKKAVICGTFNTDVKEYRDMVYV